MIPPRAGDLVEQRLQDGAVLGHVQNRKVVAGAGQDQGRRRRRKRQQLPDRKTRSRRHQPRVPPVRAVDADDRLREGEATGQGEREVA